MSSMSLGEIRAMKSVEWKLGAMRKPQRFLPQRTSDGAIIVQSKKCIGWFDPATRKGRLCTTGCFTPHLMIAKPFEFPAEFMDACVAAVGDKVHVTVY